MYRGAHYGIPGAGDYTTKFHFQEATKFSPTTALLDPVEKKLIHCRVIVVFRDPVVRRFIGGRVKLTYVGEFSSPVKHKRHPCCRASFLKRFQHCALFR